MASSTSDRSSGADVNANDGRMDDRAHAAAFEHELPEGWRWSIPRFLGMAAFLLMVIFWIWVYANRNTVAHPDQFNDPVFTEAAQTICSGRQVALEELPLAAAAQTPQERGELLELGTAELELMLADLKALDPPTDPKGADSIQLWFTDYETYLNDRVVYAGVLAEGRDEAFLQSASVTGTRVSRLIRTYAEVNRMAACAPFGDV